MNVAETRLCLLLHSLPGVGDIALARLLAHCGSPVAVAGLGLAEWRAAGLSDACARDIKRALTSGVSPAGVDIDTQLKTLQREHAAIVPITDERYPPLLRTIHSPPPLLYVRGDCGALSLAQLAVVGSRRASPAGLRAAKSLAGQLARAGLAVGSGLALGIDGAAHEGALAAAGKSVAVMATGIDRVYPARHRGLAARLAEDGCLVTEFPPGAAPLPENFPRRNRIITGLALGVLVVEAAVPSGSLISARAALEQGREVFALPWSMYHRGGAGCLQLIRDGAKMVTEVTDILEELGPLYRLRQELSGGEWQPREAGGNLSATQRALLELVGYESVSADELAQAAEMPVGALLGELSFLEMHGLIQRDAGGYIRG